jgi:anti-anti-sigma regulatory factor
MKVEITQNDNNVMVCLEGRLDTVTSSEFEKQL